MGGDLAPAGPEPASAVGRHFGIVDDAAGRLDNQRAEIAARALLGDEGHAHIAARRQIGEATQLFRRDRLVWPVRAAVGVAAGDGGKELVARFGARLEYDARRADRRVVRLECQSACCRLDRGAQAAGAGGEREILDRGAKAQMHLAPERIEGTEIARTVGEDIYRLRPNGEGPRLGVMRVGREDGGAQRPPPPVLWAALPGPPRLIGLPLALCPDSPVPGPVAEPRQRQPKAAAAD